MKKAVCLLLTLCLVFTMFAAVIPIADASNEYVINGVTVHYDDFSSSNGECWAYANAVYKKIWGSNFSSDFSSSDNYLRNLSDDQLTLTVEHLKTYVSNAPLGACLRISSAANLHSHDGYINGNPNPGHNQIIVQKDANGFTVFEGGLGGIGWPYCREKYYTWSSYLESWSYPYIKYIKWPGANPNPGSAPTISVLSTDHTSYAVDETVVFSITANGNVNNLWIYCPNGETLTYLDVGSRYELAFGMSGHFQALVETWNGVGSLCSNLIDFYVGNPTYAYLTTNKTYYAVDESVYFSITADGIQNNLWIYCPNGETLTYMDVGSSYVLGFGMSGHFQALVETWNGIGSKCSDRIDFYVGNQTVTVTFNPNGGSVSPTTKTVTIGSTYGTLPTPTRTYYNFDGWYTSATGGNKVTASTTVTATSNHTLYAHWTHVCANGHNYSYAVSTAPTTTATGTLIGTCSRCGTTTTITLPKLTTNDYNYSIIQAATCSFNGIDRYTWKTTTYGTFSFDVTIPKTGHSYTDTVTPPTCTEQGYTTHTCSRCGDSYRDSYVDALGHSFGAWTHNKAPTCTEKGEETRTCSRCSYTETRDIAATGHNWNNPVYAWADDNGSVTASRTCKTDYSHIEVETVNTTWEVTKEATYDEEGEITYTAAFQNTAFATQTKIVKTPKLEKPDDPKPNPFVDVVEGKYYYNPVLWAYYHDPQITSGTSETTFSPNDTCTRAQIVTFLWRAAGSPEPTTKNNPFDDVKSDKYYFKAVLWAAETGVTSGTSDTTFSPNDGCTRAQVVTFLWRFAGSPELTTTTNPFTDVPAGKYYTKAVLWAAEKGVTAGTSETTFSPNDTCTRGQIVTFLYRYMEG